MKYFIRYSASNILLLIIHWVAVSSSMFNVPESFNISAIIFCGISIVILFMCQGLSLMARSTKSKLSGSILFCVFLVVFFAALDVKFNALIWCLIVLYLPFNIDFKGDYLKWVVSLTPLRNAAAYPNGIENHPEQYDETLRAILMLIASSYVAISFLKYIWP